MTDSRRDTLFSIRYAERVLERYASWWHKIDVLLRFLTLLSGTSAFAALLAEHKGIATVVAIIFAVLQAIEFSVMPSRRAEEARAARRLYADVLARQVGLDDVALKAEYDAARAREEVSPLQAFKHAAYNDVLHEIGADPQYAYRLGPVERLLASIG